MSKKTERVLGPGADGDVDDTGPVTVEPEPTEPEPTTKHKE